MLRSSVRRRLNRSPAIPSHERDEEIYHHYSSEYQLEEEQDRKEMNNLGRNRSRYNHGNTHYIIKDDDDQYENRRNGSGSRGGHRPPYRYEQEEEDDISHGLQIYHDYLPELSRTPDLENAKPVIRMR